MLAGRSTNILHGLMTKLFYVFTLFHTFFCITLYFFLATHPRIVVAIAVFLYHCFSAAHTRSSFFHVAHSSSTNTHFSSSSLATLSSLCCHSKPIVSYRCVASIMSPISLQFGRGSVCPSRSRRTQGSNSNLENVRILIGACATWTQPPGTAGQPN